MAPESNICDCGRELEQGLCSGCGKPNEKCTCEEVCSSCGEPIDECIC